MNANLYALFESRFPEDRSHPFMVCEDGSVRSYADLHEGTARIARVLTRLGLEPGDRVAAQIEKSPEALLLYLAVLRAGLVFLPLNPAYQRSELQYFLADAEPRAVICDPRQLELLQQLGAPCGVEHFLTLDESGQGTLMEACGMAEAEFATAHSEGDSLATILYTSGTTGRSKGALLTHRNLSVNALTLHDYWGFEESDVLLHALPIFHVHGLFVATHCVLLNGSAMLFHRKFDAARVVAELPRTTVFMGVPTYYTRLLAESSFDRESCRNMRLFISGSAPLLEETFGAFRERTGHTILERYGMSETGMNTSNPLYGERIAGTVGVPLPGVSVRVTDDAGTPVETGTIGHMQVAGENVFRGYWRRPELNAQELTADGYFKTGDMGRFDAKGYLSIVGRSKDLVISGGFNVYPKEIETCIDEIPGVLESAVIGVPHPDFGEAVTAIVVRRKDAQDLTEASIIATLKAQLANYKIPKRVVWVDDLPRNAMGKVQKNLLRQMLAP